MFVTEYVDPGTGVRFGEVLFTIPDHLVGEILLPAPSAGLEVLISGGETGHFYRGT